MRKVLYLGILLIILLVGAGCKNGTHDKEGEIVGDDGPISKADLLLKQLEDDLAEGVYADISSYYTEVSALKYVKQLEEI